MMSLFNTFDLAMSSMLPIVAMIFITTSMIYSTSKLNLTMKNTYMMLMKFFYSLKSKNNSKAFLAMNLSILILILMINLYSILPYIFPLTSQISMVMFVSLSMWAGFMMLSLMKNPMNFTAHLTPSGTPFLLMPLMLAIEITSTLIRPVTVSIRLVANILAGHLLMVLLSKMVLTYHSMTILYLLLNMVEIAVALIQSYIFCTMMTLYYSEVK